MINATIAIGNIDEKYDNAPMELIHVACQYSSSIYLVSGTHRINAKSMLGVMAFWPTKGNAIDVEIDGADADAAAEAMKKFFEV